MKGKIFNAEEVQSILNGSKVMFREVIKPSAGLQSKWASVQGLSKCPTNYLCEVNGNLGAQFQHPLADTHQSYGYVDKMSPYGWFKCPYQVGQKIFCKESFSYIQNPKDCTRESEPCEIHYKADYDAEGLDKQDIEAIGTQFLSASKMPQWTSRLTLQIKSIGVERLADISENDCMKEGCFLNQDDMGSPVFGFCEEEVDQELGYRKAQDAFKVYWNATHKKPEEKFEANPWVWVVTMEVVE